MSDYPISATLKGKSDSRFDAPWIVIYGNNPDEVADRLDAVTNGRLIDSLVAADERIKLQTSLGATQVPQQSAPPQASGPWGGGQPAQHTGSAPQQQQRPQYGPTHPEGKTCETCNKGLEQKQTSNGNNVWRCPDWRWNNGNPNNHTSLKPGQS